MSADGHAKDVDPPHIPDPHIRQKQADVGHPSPISGHPGVRGMVLGWASLALALVQSICAAAVALSGVRVLLGLGSLIAATAAGPAQGFHREGLRVPMLWASAVLALLTLLLHWNEERIRRNPSALWRLQPLTPKQRRQRWIQLATSIGALLLILAEVVTHPWFHREL